MAGDVRNGVGLIAAEGQNLVHETKVAIGE